MTGHDKQPIGEIASVTALFVEVFRTFRPRKTLISFQMKPTSCTLLISIFISTSIHVSGNYVPIIRRIYCIYATLVFFNLVCWLGRDSARFIVPDRPYSHPYRVKNTSVA